MENLSKLKHADAKYKAVKVSHDMTPKERDEIKALIAEAKTKTRNLGGMDTCDKRQT